MKYHIEIDREAGRIRIMQSNRIIIEMSMSEWAFMIANPKNDVFRG